MLFISLPSCDANTVNESSLTEELAAPESRFEQGFSDIVGVRELYDGTVVVADALEQRVLLLDAELNSTAQIGKPGQGPGEYELITDLLPLPGGSVGVYQALSARVLEISTAGETGITTHPGLCANGRAPPISEIRWSDRNGYYYGETAPIRGANNGRPQVADSMAIVRWREPCNRDTVALIPNERFSANAVVVGRAVIEPGAKDLPFAARWQWAVSDDGMVAIVEHDPYRVRFLYADGREIVGPSVRMEKIPVAESLKDFWRSRHESRGQPAAEPVSWPRTLPPFTVEDYPIVRFAPDGSLWIKRTVTSKESQTYDVFDDVGTPIRRVEVPGDIQIVGFGDETIYAVQTDAVGLQYLLRFNSP